MTIRQIHEDKKRFMPLLFLADEQEDMIDRYLDRGDMFVLYDPEPVGECVVCDNGDGVFEIKNIATDPAVHGRGYGRALIEFVMRHYADRCRLMLVGNNNTPFLHEKSGTASHSSQLESP